MAALKPEICCDVISERRIQLWCNFAQVTETVFVGSDYTLTVSVELDSPGMSRHKLMIIRVS